MPIPWLLLAELVFALFTPPIIVALCLRGIPATEVGPDEGGFCDPARRNPR